MAANFSPKLSLVRNARVMPFQGTMDFFRSGVFDAKGRFYENSIIADRAKPSELLPVTQKLSGTYIFGGYLFFHFGHFLLESLSRLYAIRQCRNYPIIFTSPNDKTAEAHKLLFKFLRVDNEIVFQTEPVEVENLIMADAGSVVEPPFLFAEQVRALGIFRASGQEIADRKIWLSRSKFKGGGLENEAEVEMELEAMGWTIVHPEELTYLEQAQLVSTSRQVAGLDGSAFYSALLADTVHGEFTVFSRRNIIPEILRMALTAKTDKYRGFLIPLEHISGTFAEKRSILRDPRHILAHLRGL